MDRKVARNPILQFQSICHFSTHLPDKEQYGLKSQITRAAVSVFSNITEGSSRESEKDYKRFLEMAVGSSFELETQLLILKEIGYSQVEHINVTLEMVHEEQKMLQNSLQYLNKKLEA